MDIRRRIEAAERAVRTPDDGGARVVGQVSMMVALTRSVSRVDFGSRQMRATAMLMA